MFMLYISYTVRRFDELFMLGSHTDKCLTFLNYNCDALCIMANEVTFRRAEVQGNYKLV